MNLVNICYARAGTTDLLKFSGYSLESEGTKKKVQPRKYLDMTKFCPSPRMAGICLSPFLDLGSVSPRPPPARR